MITVSLPIFIGLCAIALLWWLLDVVRGAARGAERRKARRSREAAVRPAPRQAQNDEKSLDE